ncbi:MAG: hypothetical protein AB4041_06095 [Microcystaceae cyanobacterium]
MANLTQITIELPTDLIEAGERLIKAGKADSFNDLMALALRQQVSILQVSNVSDDSEDDPIWNLGKNPVMDTITDASQKLDDYLYGSL